MSELEQYLHAVCRRNLVVAIALILLVAYCRPTLYIHKPTSISSTANTPKASQLVKQPEKIMGMDISHHNGDINWSDVDKSKFQFIFVKATEGVTFVDPKYKSNITQATQYGFLTGAYHFFHPQLDVALQVKNFLSHYLPEKGFPPVLDVEVTGGLEKKAIVEAVNQWLIKVEEHTKCKPILYSGLDYYQTYLADDFSHYTLWIADYSKNPSIVDTSLEWTFWQQSESGYELGITTSVDLNLYADDRGELEALKCN